MGRWRCWPAGTGCRSRGPRERSLLALLLHAGRVVSADRLLAELWGEHLPDDPANALQTGVAKLRRAPGQAGARGLLASRRPGYVLEVAPEQVDVHRFERLLAGKRLVTLTGPGGVGKTSLALAAAGLASALLSLTLGRAGRPVTRDLATTGAPTWASQPSGTRTTRNPGRTGRPSWRRFVALSV